MWVWLCQGFFVNLLNSQAVWPFKNDVLKVIWPESSISPLVEEVFSEFSEYINWIYVNIYLGMLQVNFLCIFLYILLSKSSNIICD